MPTSTAMMTVAELTCTRSFLGFSQTQLARYLQVDLRRLQRMEKGEEAIPSGIVDELDDIYEETANLVNNLVIQYKRKVKKAEEHGDDVILVTQRDAEAMGRYPSSWHRALCARVAAEVPGLVIDYASRWRVVRDDGEERDFGDWADAVEYFTATEEPTTASIQSFA
jgi:plasmid maintenance system antidote protein VapI